MFPCCYMDNLLEDRIPVMYPCCYKDKFLDDVEGHDTCDWKNDRFENSAQMNAIFFLQFESVFFFKGQTDGEQSGER